MGNITAVHTVDDWKERMSRLDVQYYGDRGFLREDVGLLLVRGDDRIAEIQSYHEEYLRPLGFGPDRLCTVNSAGLQSFYTALQCNAESMRLMREQLSTPGSSIEAFSPSGEFQVLYGWVKHYDRRNPLVGVSRTPGMHVALSLDNKVLARSLASHLGEEVEKTYAAYDLCWDEDDVRDAMRYMLRTYGSVILKAPNLASGLGMLRVERNDDPRIVLFMKKYLDDEHGIVVEQDVGDHLSCSLQWEIDASGQAHALFMTTQAMAENKEAGICSVHDGNDIGAGFNDAFPRNWPKEIRGFVERKAWEMSLPELNWAIARGYIGRLGMDFMVCWDGGKFPRVYKSEFSARVTGASYGYGVMQQVQDRCLNASVVIRNCAPSISVSGWREANAILKQGRDISMNPDSGCGVLLGLTRRLPEKCILVSCAQSLKRARRMMHVALTRFGHTG